MAKKKTNGIAMEKDWQRRDDAYTLAKASEIKMDKARYTNAQAEASKMIEEETKRLNSLKSVAKSKR